MLSRKLQEASPPSIHSPPSASNHSEVLISQGRASERSSPATSPRLGRPSKATCSRDTGSRWATSRCVSLHTGEDHQWPKFQGKNSRAFSFVPVGGHQRPRGIQRDYRTACQSAIAWTREWWRSLSSEQQEELKGKHPAQTLPAEDDPLQEADAPPAKRHKA